MLNSNKFYLGYLQIILLGLFSMQASADSEAQQLAQLQSQVAQSNQTIAILVSDVQKNSRMLAALQARLDASDDKAHFRNADLPGDLSLISQNVGVHRTANGHGRGGRMKY